MGSIGWVLVVGGVSVVVSGAVVAFIVFKAKCTALGRGMFL